MGFSRQEYWGGLPFPSPGDLPNPAIKPRSPALQADALTSEPPGMPQLNSIVAPYWRHCCLDRIIWKGMPGGSSHTALIFSQVPSLIPASLAAQVRNDPSCW